MMTPELLKQQLQTTFSNAKITTTGEGNKFDVRIISDCFAGKRPVARQQAVYAVINNAIASGDIHAVNIQALTVEEWEKQSRFGV